MKIPVKQLDNFYGFQGLPKLYGVVMIGDDNFVNIASFELNYETHYQQLQRSKIRHCGKCASGLRIAQATEIIRTLDDSIKNVIINVGSVDIAEGRQLIELISDLKTLLNTCEEVGVDPIMTTLPPLPNHLLGNKKDILIGFNDFIRFHVVEEYAVIDLYKCMVNYEDKIETAVYQPCYRKMSGSREALVMWNKLGRKRILNMIIKNLGQALYFKHYLGDYV